MVEKTTIQMINKKGLVMCLFSILLIGFVLASFETGKPEPGYSINTVYGPGADLIGWINLSLSEEPADSVFEDNQGNSVRLIDLIKSTLLSRGTDYICNPLDCGLNYETRGEEETFTLDEGEEKIVGFLLTGEIDTVNPLDFVINSTAGESCENQLEIDFFVDGEIETGNNEGASGDCPTTKSYGCFDPSESTDTFPVDGDENMYCQRIELSKSPGFEIGAQIKRETGAIETKVAIYDLYLIDELASCTLTHTIPFDGEQSCEVVDFLVTEPEDYYVCVFNEGEGIDEKTSIIGYEDSEGCGLYSSMGYTGGGEGYSFKIFAQGKKFAPIGEINLEDESIYEDGFGNEIERYIVENYGYDCTEGCVIPIKLISNADQEIMIKDISGSYNAGIPKLIEKIYDVESSAATITTVDFQKISLDKGNFTLPNDYGEKTYVLELEGEEIIDEKINITKVPEIKKLIPLVAFDDFPIEFTVDVKAINNTPIIKYIWEFADSAPQNLTSNKASYTFTQTGTFPVKITVIDSRGRLASRVFDVDVQSYIGLYDKTLIETKTNLNNLETELDDFENFEKSGVESVLDINGTRDRLSDIEDDWSNASTDSEYKAVVNELLGISVPDSLSDISTNMLSFYPSGNYVEMSAVTSAFGGSYETSEEAGYVNGVLMWNAENLESKIKQTKIQADYNGRKETILSVFELKVTNLGTTSASIFIRELDDLDFGGSYGQGNLTGGYREIPLNTATKTIKFSTTQDISLNELPVFISPALDDLTVIPVFEESKLKEMRWLIFGLIILFLVILAVIIYIIMQNWYKTKYENYLFKKRNYLFNIIHFVDAQKKKGASNKEIIKKLKKAGWNSEQINYVMKKYVGKRTGMLEIPVKKVVKEVTKAEKEKKLQQKQKRFFQK